MDLSDEDWDWQDEWYTNLAQHLHIGTFKDFEELEYFRAKRWYEKLSEDMKNDDVYISVREQELMRVAARAMGKPKT